MADLDVLIVGAGLSGIGAAARLKRECPQLRWAIAEGRAGIGGTWDLFRFPGVRSDTDPFTMSYPFRPWAGDRSVASGAEMLAYLEDIATQDDIGRHVRFRTTVTAASWSSAEAAWTVQATRDGTPEVIRTRFLYVCAGYYSYEAPYRPEFPGEADFQGQLIHPQFWPADLDHSGRRIVVIGSGATAVTLVPALARTAAAVTMLQRSPSYVLALPEIDQIARVVRRVLPADLAHRVIRAKNVLLLQGIYELCRRTPKLARKVCRRVVLSYLKDPTYVDRHFGPNYEPWDQRLCLAPDGDIFQAVRDGRATVVTDAIDRFVPEGIRLRSGTVLEADIVVTATGLNLRALGGVALDVDGVPVDLPSTTAYRALMLSGVPNLAFCFGYANSSWTLRADVSSRYVCRLLAHMERIGHEIAVPTAPAGPARLPFLDLMSGYVKRGIDDFPRAGTTGPWVVSQNHLRVAAGARRPDVTAGMTFPARTRTHDVVGP